MLREGMPGVGLIRIDCCYNGLMLNIRNASANDIPLVLQFIRELAELRKSPGASGGDTGRFTPLTASPPIPNFEYSSPNGRASRRGLHFSSITSRPGWAGRRFFSKTCLCDPRFRGKGIGKALLLHLAKVAVDEGCGRFEWQVLDWNTPPSTSTNRSAPRS